MPMAASTAVQRATLDSAIRFHLPAEEETTTSRTGSHSCDPFLFAHSGRKKEDLFSFHPRSIGRHAQENRRRGHISTYLPTKVDIGL